MAIIEYTTEDHRAVITINRPDARNAVNGDVASGIEEAIDRLEADDALWVGILTGVPPVFSAGADLKEINAGRRRLISPRLAAGSGVSPAGSGPSPSSLPSTDRPSPAVPRSRWRAT